MTNVYILTSNGGFISEDELYHHGIKGMKWGVRRFQKEDGSLTSAGRKRYSDDDSTSSDKSSKSSDGSKSPKKGLIQKRKDKLTEHYIQKGYQPDAAKTMAAQRMRTEAVVAAIGVVALTSAAVVVSRRIGQDYFDKTIKSGKIIQNIGASSKSDFQDQPFFAAINRHDKKAYANLYPSEKRRMVIRETLKNDTDYWGIYNNRIKLNSDVKRASVANARKIFYEQMDKDPEFKKEVLDTLKKTKYDNAKAINDYMSDGKHSKKLYDSFNRALATPQFQAAGLHKKYYNEMQKHGYNAILDINDSRYSGYKKISKNPTIFFGSTRDNKKWEKISKMSVDELDMDTNARNYTLGFLAKQEAKKLGVYAGVYAGAKTVSDQRAIKKYLDEHPDSKLSGKEILKAVGRDKKAKKAKK